MRWRGSLLGVLLLAAGCVTASDRAPDGQPVDELRAETNVVWNVNDVSILYPRAKPEDADALVPMRWATETGEKVLLPEALFARLGDPNAHLPYLIEAPGRDQLYPRLRVTSVRVDPCAEVLDLENATTCTRQIRLSVQPTEESVDPNGISFLDASVHLFYELDDEAFVDMLLELRDLAEENTGNPPLSAHPVMEREGVSGPWAKRFRDLLGRHCDAANLTRMTFMATGRANNTWFWHQLDRQPDGTFTESDVPELAQKGDGWATLTRDENDRDHGDGDPRTRFPKEALKTSTILALDDQELARVIDELRRLQNPNLTSAANTACSSCHGAETVLDHVLAVRGVAAEPTPSTFVAPPDQNVTRTAGLPPYSQTNVHAFSWFDLAGERYRGPAISQRVINESARIAAYLGSDAFTRTLTPAAHAKWRASLTE